MQNVRNILLSIGAAIAGTKVIRAVSDLGVDDFLSPIGLTRRRSHAFSGLALLGAGILVGGAAGIIFAPASGRDTRKRLSQKADQLGDEAVERLRELRDEVRPRLANAENSKSHHP